MGAPDPRPLGTLSTILDSPLLLNSILELWKGLLSLPREYFNRKEKISDNVYYYYRQWRQMLIYMYMFYFVVWGQNWYFFCFNTGAFHWNCQTILVLKSFGYHFSVASTWVCLYFINWKKKGVRISLNIYILFVSTLIF